MIAAGITQALLAGCHCWLAQQCIFSALPPIAGPRFVVLSRWK